MPTVTATPVPAAGYVRVVVDCADTPTAKGVILKRYPTGSDLTVVAPAAVRGTLPLASYNGSKQAKAYVKLSAGWAVYYDYEAPFGVSLTYAIETDADTVATVGANLIGNPSFTTDAAGWTAYNANSGAPARTVATFTGWPPSGPASGLASCTTAGTFGAMYGNVPVTAGLKYGASVWALVSTARNVTVLIDWLTTAGAYISTTSGATVGATANTPTLLTAAGTAPATATKANVYVQVLSGAVGNALYVDSARLSQVTDATVPATSAAVTLAPAAGVGWLKDPQRPELNVKLICNTVSLPDPTCDTGVGVYFIGVAGKKFAADAKNMDVPGAARGSTAYSIRKDATSTLKVVTRAVPDRDALKALLASGAPLLLQLPAEYDEPDQYIQVGEAAEDRLHADQRVPWRGFTLPYTVEDAPVGQARGPVGARYRDLSQYSTWTALKATGKTYAQMGTV